MQVQGAGLLPAGLVDQLDQQQPADGATAITDFAGCRSWAVTKGLDPHTELLVCCSAREYHAAQDEMDSDAVLSYPADQASERCRGQCSARCSARRREVLHVMGACWHTTCAHRLLQADIAAAAAATCLAQ